MMPILQLGPLSLPLPGVLLIAGLALGETLAERWAARLRVPRKVVEDVLLYGLLGGVVAARVFYALAHPAAFAASPLSLFSLNPGLLDPVGGVIGGLAIAWWWAQRRGLTLLQLLDVLTPFFAVMAIALALSLAARGDFFGEPTTLPWAVELWGAARHPVQLYWALAAAGVLFAVDRWTRERATYPTPGAAGWLFGRFLAWSAWVFVLVAGLRGDSPVSPGGWRLDQVAGLVALAVGLYLWRRADLRESDAFPM